MFGIALDDMSPPNVYLTATSAFGLHRTADNSDWMPGMWGSQGGPGTVWKLNKDNNYQPEIFSEITLKGRKNTGAALGNIAFDKWNKQLYVSDLETGMIHRLGQTDGKDLGAYDHGMQGRASFTDAGTGNQTSLKTVSFDTSSAVQISPCSGGDFRKPRPAGISPISDAVSGAWPFARTNLRAMCVSIMRSGAARVSATRPGRTPPMTRATIRATPYGL